MEQPLCQECPAEAVARLSVGSLGIQADLCSDHLQARKRSYDLALTPVQVTSLVRLPDRIEDQYAEVVGDLRESERATSESLSALDAATAKISRLELDAERLARRVSHEKTRANEHEAAAARLDSELHAEREKTEKLSTELAELEAHTASLEEEITRLRVGSEGESTDPGSPAAGERGAVVEGSEPPPPTGR